VGVEYANVQEAREWNHLFRQKERLVAKKQIKVGVCKGDGPAPGYLWNVAILDIAFREVMGFLKQAE